MPVDQIPEHRTWQHAERASVPYHSNMAAVPPLSPKAGSAKRRRSSVTPSPSLTTTLILTQGGVRDEAPQQCQRLLSEPHALPPQPPPCRQARRLAVGWSQLLTPCVQCMGSIVAIVPRLCCTVRVPVTNLHTQHGLGFYTRLWASHGSAFLPRAGASGSNNYGKAPQMIAHRSGLRSCCKPATHRITLIRNALC